MQIEGRLTIRLSTADGRVKQVDISSSRPVRAARVFAGKPATDVLNTLPLLFSVCGTAQACAAVRALEQARGISVPTTIEVLRDRLVELETVREHCLRISQDWPGFIDQEPDALGMRDILGLNRAMMVALVGDTRSFFQGAPPDFSRLDQLESLLARLGRLLESTIFGLSPREWLQLDGPEALGEWAIKFKQPAASLVRLVLDRNWEDLGSTQITALPSLQRKAILQALSDDQFENHPTWSGKCCETGSLSRTFSPLLAWSLAEHGRGLLSRLLARLTELAQLVLRLETVPRDFGGVALESTPVSPHNPGIGQVAAARGQLIHQVTLEHDLVRDYRIVAPTEWNFHPRGLMQQSLLGLSGQLNMIKTQARLLINAVDPCVAYDLSVK